MVTEDSLVIIVNCDILDCVCGVGSFDNPHFPDMVRIGLIIPLVVDEEFRVLCESLLRAYALRDTPTSIPDIPGPFALVLDYRVIPNLLSHLSVMGVVLECYRESSLIKQRHPFLESLIDHIHIILC